MQAMISNSTPREGNNLGVSALLNASSPRDAVRRQALEDILSESQEEPGQIQLKNSTGFRFQTPQRGTSNTSLELEAPRRSTSLPGLQLARRSPSHSEGPGVRLDPPEAPLVGGAADATAAPARAAALDEEDDLPLTTMFKTASAASVATRAASVDEVAAQRGKKMLELIGKVRDQRAALRKEEKAAAKKGGGDAGSSGS